MEAKLDTVQMNNKPRATVSHDLMITLANMYSV